MFLSIELLENVCFRLKVTSAFLIGPVIAYLRHTFHAVEDNKLSNQVLQTQSDDENLDVMMNETHYLEL